MMAQQRVATVLHFVLICISFSCSQAAFHHRQRSSSIVLKNVLYIDGGEIITWSGQGTGLVSNGSAKAQFQYLPENDTYSIDLTQAWTNTSVTINTIPKKAPVEVSGNLWSDAAGQSFYAYNGGQSFFLADYYGAARPTVTSNQLWQFIPSGLSGSWSQVPITGNGTNLVRIMEATYGSGNGLGFALGGLINAAVDQTYPTGGYAEAPHGMVIWNMTSNTWQNVSAGYDYARGSLVGAGLYVPEFGPEGVFLTFGGITDQQAQIPLDNAFIYEPLSQQWAIQSVTGDTPPGSNNPCVVGVQGDNGTYEIFLYGGEQPTVNDQRIIDGSVYVLTLPAFHWTKIPATVYGRYRHTCNVAGNRQMISVGGIVFPGPLSNDNDTLNGGPDPWPNGLGVFDMTDLVWKSSYQPDAKSYVTADKIKSYYQSNGQYPSSWTSDSVNQWFVRDSTINATSTSSSNTASATSIPSSTSTQAVEGGSNSTLGSLGAVIGGAVGGGVALILILIAAYFFTRRRRYKNVKQDEFKANLDDSLFRDQNGNAIGELHAESKPHELTSTNTYQLHSDARPYETSGTAVNELHANARPFEADGRPRYELPVR